MRCLVIGTGSIGQRHCRNLLALGHEVAAWDIDPARRNWMSASGGVEVLSSVEQGLTGRADAALVCTPPSTHVELALAALRAGLDVFVEKPIAESSAGVPRLLEEADRRDRIIMVGFNLRFLPSLRRVKDLLDDKRVGEVLAARAEFGSYLPDWRAGGDYRDSYAVRAELGGGVLLDAIHELDYLGWFFGEAVHVSCTAEHRSALAGDTEDLAEVTLGFRSGVLAQVHLDYLQRVYRRNLQVIGDRGTILWDYPGHAVTVHGLDAETARDELGPPDGDANRMYVDELAHFVECVERRATPPVDGREALRSLRTVEAAKRSSRERRRVSVE